MRPMHALALTLPLLSLLNSCVTLQTPKLPLPKMHEPDSSGLGISLRLRPPITLRTQEPHAVYFARLDGKGGIRQIQLLLSNYVREGRVYLLNLPPGTYAAVAAVYSLSPDSPGSAQTGVSVSPNNGRRSWMTYFPKDLIEQTQVTLQRGEFVFMGHYVVDMSVGLNDADPIQLHYSDVIAPGAIKSGGGDRSRGYHYRGSIHAASRGDDARTEFLLKAREDLAEGGWTAVIR